MLFRSIHAPPRRKPPRALRVPAAHVDPFPAHAPRRRTAEHRSDTGPRALTHRAPARRLVRDWEKARWDVRWDVDPIAPIPLTFEQARTLLPDVHVEQYSGVTWIWAFVGDGSLAYWFDAQGRTVKVDWDPNADSAVYVFHYQYSCPGAPGDARPPVYADDSAPPGASPARAPGRRGAADSKLGEGVRVEKD